MDNCQSQIEPTGCSGRLPRRQLVACKVELLEDMLTSTRAARGHVLMLPHVISTLKEMGLMEKQTPQPDIDRLAAACVTAAGGQVVGCAR